MRRMTEKRVLSLAPCLPLLLLFISGCAHSPRVEAEEAETDVPVPEAAVPVALKPGDARRALVGTWQLLVGADTLATHRDSLVWKAGTLLITDTLFSRTRPEIKADLTPPFGDLVDLAGGSWAINGPPPVLLGGSALALNHKNGSWEIDLSPTMFDVGVSLTGKFSGDSLTGTWSESVMGGVARSGRFVMRRTSAFR